MSLLLYLRSALGRSLTVFSVLYQQVCFSPYHVFLCIFFFLRLNKKKKSHVLYVLGVSLVVFFFPAHIIAVGSGVANLKGKEGIGEKKQTLLNSVFK